MKKIKITLILSLLLMGCSNLIVSNPSGMKVEKYSISMAHYAIDNNRIFIRLADQSNGAFFKTDSGRRFQIYFVADHSEEKGLENVKSYFISSRDLGLTDFQTGSINIKRIELNSNKLSALLEMKSKGKEESKNIDFTNISLKKVSYPSLLAMDIEYDESCILNKDFSIYTNNKILGKHCPKENRRFYAL